jgi:tetratricopeptide (TPR) repeat protein
MASIVLALLVAAAPQPRKTVAVVAPAALDGALGWVSLAVADNLATSLLDYRRPADASGVSEYPIDVFTWRESARAARAENVDTSRLISEADARKLARQLGARWVFIGSYRPKGAGAITFQWRVVDAETRRGRRDVKVATNLTTLSGRVEALSSSVLRDLGERPGKAGRRAPVPAAALAAYGRALEILARQSLDPGAAVVLPPIELKKVQALGEKATKIAPRFARAWVAMGLASAMLGDMARAEKEVLRAVSDTDDFEALDALGPYYLYTRQGRPEDAIRALTDAVGRRSGFLLGLGYLGNTYLRVGRARQAAEVFASYAARVPGSPWARLMHARASFGLPTCWTASCSEPYPIACSSWRTRRSKNAGDECPITSRSSSATLALISASADSRRSSGLSTGSTTGSGATAVSSPPLALPFQSNASPCAFC